MITNLGVRSPDTNTTRISICLADLAPLNQVPISLADKDTGHDSCSNTSLPADRHVCAMWDGPWMFSLLIFRLKMGLQEPLRLARLVPWKLSYPWSSSLLLEEETGMGDQQFPRKITCDSCCPAMAGKEAEPGVCLTRHWKSGCSGSR